MMREMPGMVRLWTQLQDRLRRRGGSEEQRRIPTHGSCAVEWYRIPGFGLCALRRIPEERGSRGSRELLRGCDSTQLRVAVMSALGMYGDHSAGSREYGDAMFSHVMSITKPAGDRVQALKYLRESLGLTCDALKIQQAEAQMVWQVRMAHLPTMPAMPERWASGDYSTEVALRVCAARFGEVYMARGLYNQRLSSCNPSLDIIGRIFIEGDEGLVHEACKFMDRDSSARHRCVARFCQAVHVYRHSVNLCRRHKRVYACGGLYRDEHWGKLCRMVHVGGLEAPPLFPVLRYG